MSIRLFAVVLLFVAQNLAALEITTVQANPTVVERGTDTAVEIRFHVNEPCSVRLDIFDGRDLLIWSDARKDLMAAGEHVMRWDGLDKKGLQVPPEAYVFTLSATNADGVSVEHDLTDVTGRDHVQVRDIEWDPEAESISYTLVEPSRVNIRIGLQQGPLLRTVVDWVARGSGRHSEPWDGLDASGVLDLSRHPKLDVSVAAYALSDNTIVVGPLSQAPIMIADMPWGQTKRVPKKTFPKRMFDYAQQPMESRRDFTIQLVLPDDLKKTRNGVPIVSDTVPVRLEIAKEDRVRALSRRFEPVFFVDGMFVFENEIGFLPMTWMWDPLGTNEGIHYLTANLRGYEGNFGMATVKIFVKPERASQDNPQ